MSGAISIPLPDYKENLKKIVNHRLLSSHQPKIILFTPPPIDQYQRLDYEGPNLARSPEVTMSYANACKDVAAELDLPVLDIWTLFMEKAGWNGDEKLPGSLMMPRNDVLGDLLIDGRSLS